MADKTVSIGVTDPETNTKLALTFKHVTKCECEEDLDNNNTDTFDGPVGRGTEFPGYSIDISQLDLEAPDSVMSARERYVLLKKILKIMRSNKGTITVSEMSYPRGEAPFKVTENYNGVLLSSNKHTIDPKDLTARDLSFSAESRDDVEP
ncbi:hypothetical protein [Methanobrevibacter sp.]|uniref:hypothetical protein n=1 Tax=Methanobrevibacter sp. TaxID=66852 RepID=UPI00388D777B